MTRPTPAEIEETVKSVTDTRRHAMTRPTLAEIEEALRHAHAVVDEVPVALPRVVMSRAVLALAEENEQLRARGTVEQPSRECEDRTIARFEAGSEPQDLPYVSTACRVSPRPSQRVPRRVQVLRRALPLWVPQGEAMTRRISPRLRAQASVACAQMATWWDDPPEVGSFAMCWAKTGGAPADQGSP